MKKKIIIDGNFPSETRVVLLDKNNNIENIEFSSTNKKQIKGNIYLAKVTRIEPSLQAAFVDYGEEKSGFLPFSEIHSDYYQTLASESKNHTVAGKELLSPEITSEDLKERKVNSNFHEFIDSDDIDIDAIEKMVDEKIASNIDISAEDDEIVPVTRGEISEEKSFKIQEVIKKGQILLVQATKEERGNKGASLTTYISLAGKYCVLMPNKDSQNGISRKISNQDERKRLKKIINDFEDKTNGSSSVIVRTAGAGRTTLEIKKDYDYLARLWNKIRDVTLKSKAPCFIHQEDGLILKTIRDMFDSSVKEIMVQGKEAYSLCQKYMNDVSPTQAKSLKEYKSKTPIFTKFGIEDQIIKLYQPVVHLPSGGYIVINPTEALISIDVNSGKSTGERNIEEMALKTNLEAAREIARQSRLRDLSGLLVLDFIDLSEVKNRKILERSLWEYFSKDKARIQTAPISTFGLLEMSRQRLRPSFLEMNSNICSHCNGKGLVRASEPNSMLILRTIENEIFNGRYTAVNVYGMADSVLYLLNNKKDDIAFIENKYSIKINFLIDPDATSDSYSIEKIKGAEKIRKVKEQLIPALQDTYEIYNLDNEEENSTSLSSNRKKIEKTKKSRSKDSEQVTPKDGEKKSKDRNKNKVGDNVDEIIEKPSKKATSKKALAEKKSNSLEQKENIEDNIDKQEDSVESNEINADSEEKSEIKKRKKAVRTSSKTRKHSGAKSKTKKSNAKDEEK